MPNCIVLYSLHSAGTAIDLRTIIMNACLVIWGLRLSIHIGLRHVKEDYRYVEIRRLFMKGGYCCYLICTYLFIFFGQASLALIVNAPVLYTSTTSSAIAAIGAGEPL